MPDTYKKHAVQMETLEERRLLSSVFVDGEYPVVLVRGTLEADTIDVQPAGADQISVDVNGEVEYYQRDLFRIYIRGLPGHDSITVNPDLDINTRIWGAQGNDTIITGLGRDTIYGDAGNDVIMDDADRNFVYTGVGRDRFIGGSNTNSKLFSYKNRIVNTGYQEHGFIQFSNGLFRRASQIEPLSARQPSVNPNAFNGTVTGYTASQIRTAYGFGDLTDGTFDNRGDQQNIAIVIAFDAPTVKADLDFFADTFGTGGIPDDRFTQVYAGGRAPATDPDWALELALDTQWAHAIAPAANIIVVHADTNLDWDMLAATDIAGQIIQDLGGGVVSMSFGIEESFVGTVDAWSDVFGKYEDVSFIAASGDDGSSIISHPATDPAVTSVGGTNLPLDASGARTGAETAWTGSGGGISSVFPTPGYQNGVLLGGATRIDDLGQRVHPDVAMVADPETGVAVFTTTASDGDTGWIEVGGTSASAPMFAGLVTLANELRARESRDVIGAGLNPLIYSIGQSGDRDSSFLDITEGDNGGFEATEGYDAVTGWGTPIAGSGGLIDRLAETDVDYFDVEVSWKGLYSPPFLSVESPIYIEQTGGVGRISGTEVLSARFETTAFDRFRLNDNHLDDVLSFDQGFFRRSDDSVYGYGTAIIFPYATDLGSPFVFNIRIDGTISADGNGEESIRGEFFAIDEFGDRIDMSPFGRDFDIPSLEGEFYS